MFEWSTTLADLEVGVVPTARGPIETARVGEGPAVLLVHGIPGSWRQAVPLAEDLPGFEVLLPSRPGYGTTRLRVGLTFDQQGDAYAALLDALGIKRCAVVGISGGGPSAIAFATRHPDRTTALVLACALAPHLMKAPASMRLLKVPMLAEVLSPPVRALARRKLRRPGAVEAWMRSGLTPDEFERSQADPRIRDDLVRFTLSHQDAPAGIAGQRNDYFQVSRARSRPQKIGVSASTLVMHGDADTVVPLEHARYHADNIPGAELQVYENAGHVFLFTRRPETSVRIRDFIHQRSF